MTITVNGNKREMVDVKNVQELVSCLFKKCGGIVVQLNGEIVQKNHWREQTVTDGDVIELIQFVGGG